MRETIEAAGAKLDLFAALFADLNPIEMALSRLKALLRKAAEQTIPALWDRIGELIDASPHKYAPITSNMQDMPELKPKML